MQQQGGLSVCVGCDRGSQPTHTDKSLQVAKGPEELRGTISNQHCPPYEVSPLHQFSFLP